MQHTGTLRAATAAAAAIILAMTLGACGRRGDIIPPGTVVPQQVRDLRAEPRAGAVVLAWSMPSENVDGTPLGDLEGFDIMRTRLPEGSDECDCRYEVVRSLYLALPEDAVVSGRRVAWSEAGGLESGARYGYIVRPFNSGGYRGPESNRAALVFLQPPPVPEGLSAKAGDGSAALSWNAVSLPEAHLAGYNVYRSEEPGAVLARPVNREPVTEPYYLDTGLVNGKKYHYRVAALSGASMPYSESAPSDEVAVAPEDLIAPGRPYGLQAVPTEFGVLVSWLPSADPDLAGYILYRKGPDDDAPAPLAGMPVKGITYTDSGVEAGGTYTYAVSAFDGAVPPNESALSERVTVTLP